MSLANDTEEIDYPLLYEPDERFWEERFGVTVFSGHGVPVEGRGGKTVLISLHREKCDNDLMVKEEDWKEFIDKRCPHGWGIWQCKDCLSNQEIRRMA